jgi:choline dehydrogenase-like flavoprotein
MAFTSLASSYTYIIVGGGTSGCVLASRLATHLPESTILLIEAGRDSGVSSDVLVPGKYIHQLLHDKEGQWELPTIPQPELDGRELVFLRGRQVGGSSYVLFSVSFSDEQRWRNEWCVNVWIGRSTTWL